MAISDCVNITIEDIVHLLSLPPLIHDRYQGEFSFEDKKKIVRKNYESLIWALGEEIRQLLKRQRKLRKNPAIWSLVRDLCEQDKFGKGRESFVMLLGQYGGTEQVPTLLHLLEDSELHGHALYSLRLLGAPEARAAALRFLDSDKSWVRREAKRLLDKLDN